MGLLVNFRLIKLSRSYSAGLIIIQFGDLFICIIPLVQIQTKLNFPEIMPKICLIAMFVIFNIKRFHLHM
jgi:hypothetical protein